LSRDPSKPEGLAWVESVVEKNPKGAAGKKIDRGPGNSLFCFVLFFDPKPFHNKQTYKLIFPPTINQSK